MSVGDIVRVVRTGWRRIAAFALVGALIGVAFWAATPRRYLSAASLVPQARRGQAGLSGIAAQFGISLPQGGDGGLSPAVYASLLRSRELLGALVDQPIVGPGGQPARIADLYDVPGRTPTVRRDNTIKRLQKLVSSTADAKTGVVDLVVLAPQPWVAQQVNLRLIDLLNRFNLVSRQSQAAAERRFTERRLSEVRADLRTAENRLQQFLQGNREFRGSPELTFTQERLGRDVSLQQQLFTVLAQAYEQAKIEEVRDTPVITVLQRPEVPVTPEKRGSVVKTLGGFTVGALVGLVVAIAGDLRRRTAAPAVP